jgi:hypothetical protein
MRLILGKDQTSPRASALAILKSVARARAWREQLISGEAEGIKHLARLHQLRVTSVRKIFPFGFLSPASIEAVLNGEIASNLSLDSIAGRIPIAWEMQSTLICSK